MDSKYKKLINLVKADKASNLDCWLSENPSFLNFCGEQGSAISVATGYEKYKSLIVLLNKGCDPDLPNGLPLFNACKIRYIERKKSNYIFRTIDRLMVHSGVEYISALLKFGAVVERRHSQTGMTPLLCSVQHQSEAEVECLLSNGANPNAYEPDEITPLIWMLASRIERSESTIYNIAQKLINYGADLGVAISKNKLSHLGIENIGEENISAATLAKHMGYDQKILNLLNASSQ